MKNITIIVSIFLTLIISTKAWDNEELEIFDVVEEVNQNFYELMGLSQQASAQEIKRAFRNLSIQLHPDKNAAEDANVQFRNLVSVYEVLKDPGKREKYNKVLKEGLPNWKSAIYYYRRVRKMGLAEMAAILFVIISIGQYFVSWAAYIEKKYTAEQLFGTKLKKLQKKNKTNVDLDVILSEIPAPSVFNTLPFQIPRAIWNIPKAVKSCFGMLYEYKRQEMERRKQEAEEIERQKLIEEEIVKEREAKKEQKESMRKRKQARKAPEKTDEELAGYSQLKIKEETEDDAVKPVRAGKVQLSGGLWTDDDLSELVRLVKKYPSGCPNRWEAIAEAMNRSVPEVTFMAAKLKENGYRIPGHAENTTENLVQEATAIKKVKTKKTTNAILVPETNWSQDQQRALEAAITNYRKTGTDRWQKIANSVPGKTKEECLVRYKYLVELVKSQKEKKDDNGGGPEANDQAESIELEKIENHESEDICQDHNSGIELIEPLSRDDVIADDEDGGNLEDVKQEPEEIEIEEEVQPTKKKGKPRNKRKERKKRQEFSSDEYSD